MPTPPNMAKHTVYPCEEVLKEIGIERDRQRRKEGWTIAHDDDHGDGSLSAAAAAYAFQASTMAEPKEDGDDLLDAPRGSFPIVKLIWPQSWSWQWWKPKDIRRNLIRAGALIVAEIERLDRLEAKRAKRRNP